mmetsp:Transcript_26884/g.83654  ORF Transcript_26884/g.83654 Transcript_26884/m.83654 type:complete len:216 (+) Transcript_26884:3-650(+)
MLSVMQICQSEPVLHKRQLLERARNHRPGVLLERPLALGGHEVAEGERRLEALVHRGRELRLVDELARRVHEGRGGHLPLQRRPAPVGRVVAEVFRALARQRERHLQVAGVDGAALGPRHERSASMALLELPSHQRGLLVRRALRRAPVPLGRAPRRRRLLIEERRIEWFDAVLHPRRRRRELDLGTLAARVAPSRGRARLRRRGAERCGRGRES